jgi:hypothetical protein
MSKLSNRNEQREARVLPFAMIAIGLAGVFLGLLDPGGSSDSRPPALPVEQIQLVRADTAAGFPPPPLPDNPPRGPGA